MLILLSPAKSLDESPYAARPTTVPDFLDRSETLIRELCTLSIAEIRSLMKISQNLATLNKGRYQRFHRPFTPHNAKPAALMFRGDVYRGLQFDALKAAEQNYSQLHLRILSGLYGLLRPLDLIQPYRLEMGTRLSVGRGHPQSLSILGPQHHRKHQHSACRAGRPVAHQFGIK